MSYAAQADLELRYGAAELLAIADRDGDGIVDAGVVAAAVADAEQLADSYLAPRYATPLLAAPAPLVAAVCDMARYKLYANAREIPDHVKQAWSDALKFLRDLSEGRAVLAGATSAAPANPQHGAQVVAPTRIFSPVVMRMPRPFSS